MSRKIQHVVGTTLNGPAAAVQATVRAAQARSIAAGLLLALLGCAQLSATSAQAAEAPTPESLDLASQIIQASGAAGGIAAVIGRTDADLALAIAKQGPFTVHCLAAGDELRDRMRQTIHARARYGVVSAATFDGTRLPYAENLLNLVIADSFPTLAKSGLTSEELLRVLAPLGTAFLGVSAGGADDLATQLRRSGHGDVSVINSGGGWVRLRKAWPAEIDEWTHYLHGADGNPVARDTVVGPPRRYQWTAGPQWLRSHETDSSVSTLVTAQGRLFLIVDEAPISLVGDHPLPDKWFLVARDAFNGVLLWKVPIRRWGWREWKETWFNNRPGDIPLNIQKRLVAAGDKVYVTLGYRAPVSELDARTGEILKTYAGTEGTGEILCVDGTLVLSIFDEGRLKIVAVDAASGKPRWTTPVGYRGSTVDYIKWATGSGKVEPPQLDPSVNMASDGRIVALIDGPEIVCLDGQSGRERWRSPFPADEADQTAGGMKSQGNLWIGTMIVADGVVLHASPSVLAAFSAADGKLLWRQTKKYIGHLWYEWKDVFVIDRFVWTWSPELDEAFFEIGRSKKQRTFWPRTVNAYDLSTGDLKQSIPLGNIFKAHHHHRCYRNKATLRYILASRRGTECVDLQEGKHTVDNWVRGTCHVGMMPANGLQYVPPHPCQCYIDEKLNGLFALAPAESRIEGQESRAEHPLQRGPAFNEMASSAPASDLPSAGDWPTFRHDSRRTGSVTTEVPRDVKLLWRVKLAAGKLSAPIAVGDKIYAAVVDEHHLACLEASDGSTRWQFAAGGRIDSPPTYHRGTVLFGSADGWVYCLKADDGRLVWRFRGAPRQRLIGAFDQLESAWPVHGSVLVENGTVYFAAGRSSQVDGGIRMFGLDAASGAIRHQTTLAGPHYTVGDLDENFQLPMGVLPDILVSDGAAIFMRSAAFDSELNRRPGRPPFAAPSGLLDDSYFKRVPWNMDGEYGRLLVHDNRSVYYVRMFDSLRGLDPTVFFTPAARGYLLFAKNTGGGRSRWSERIPVRIRAMALAENHLFVAGPPDVVDPKDPLGAFEGRKGALLNVFDAATGEKVTEHVLPFPPVFNGIAVADGKLYLTEEDGSVSCFGTSR